MATDSKTSKRCARRGRRAYRTRVMYDIASATEFTMRAHRKYRYRSPVVVGNEYEFAGGMDAYVRRACAFRPDGIQQGKAATHTVNRIRAHRTRVGAIVILISFAEYRYSQFGLNASHDGFESFLKISR